MASESLHDWLVARARGTRHEHIVDLFVMVEREMNAYNALRESVRALEELHAEDVPPPAGFCEPEDEELERARAFYSMFGVESPFDVLA